MNVQISGYIEKYIQTEVRKKHKRYSNGSLSFFQKIIFVYIRIFNMVASSLESITAKLVQQLQQQGGQSSKQEDSKQIEQLQQLQHFFDQQQKSQQQQQQKGGQQQQQAGNVKVYTGPKDGKFIINKHGKKVYIDRKTLNANLQYQKAKPKAKKAKKARK